MASTGNVNCKVANIVLPFFFKSNCNPDDRSFLVIPLKFLAITSFETNLNSNKVASNLESKHNNLIVQLVCLGGLPTFTPPTTPDLFKIQVLPNEENKPLPKNFFKTTMSFANAKTYELQSFHG